MKTCVIAGWGDSLKPPMPAGDVICVSGAIYHIPPPAHWVAMDHADHYHVDVGSFDCDIHVKNTSMGWTSARKLHRYDCRMVPIPQLNPDDRNEDGEVRLFTGISFCLSSMTCAVQIGAHLGYERMVFHGCDFRNGYCNWLLPNAMKVWKPHFERAGIEWCVSSDYSALSEFLPVLEAV